VFDKRLLVTGAALAVVIMAAVVAANIPAGTQETMPLHEPVSDVEKPPQEESEAAHGYVLREHQGRIGVFTGNAGEPDMVLDVLVKYLPEYDRQILGEGIPVDSYEQLVALIEDYTS